MARSDPALHHRGRPGATQRDYLIHECFESLVQAPGNGRTEVDLTSDRIAFRRAY